MRELYDEVMHWSRGVITSAEPDRGELKHALVRADNVEFTSVADGVAQVRKRRGMTLVNRLPVNDTGGVSGPSIVYGTPYRYKASGVTTYYTVVLTGTGNVHFFEDDGSATDLTPTSSLAGVFNNDIVGGDSAQMNNRLFVFDRKGGQAAFLDDEETNFGVAPPVDLVLGTGGAGAMTGDYQVAVTAWDDDIKAESDITAFSSITLSADQMTVQVDAVAVGLTNMHFRVYLRKETLGGPGWRVLAGTGYVGGTVMGFPLFSAGATVSTTIDVSDATLEDYILEPPPVNARGVPPSTAKYAAVFARRLFLADDDNVYWSELDLPDAFNPLSQEPIASPNGGKIVGIMPMANGRGLHIWTETGRHSIVGGADPNGWTIDIEDPELGAVSRGGIVGYRKVVATWDADQGPLLLNTEGGASYIGTDMIRNDVKPSALSSGSFENWLSAALDGRIIFGIVEGGQTKVQKFLVFNLEVGAWESTNWDPMDAASIFVSYDDDGDAHLYLGNYNGQLFRMMQNVGTDGVRDGTVSGTFTAGATSIATIEDLTAAFDVTSAGLRQRRVRLIDADGIVVDSARIHVTSNTATELTLSANFSGLTVGEVYTYAVGGPDFVMETYWGHMGVPFIDKRFDVLYSEFRVDEGVSNIAIRMAFAWDSNRSLAVSVADSSSSLWDEAEWDVAEWDGLTEITRRMPIIRRGINYRIQLRNPYPNQGFTVLKLAVLARQLSDRYAGNTLRDSA